LIPCQSLSDNPPHCDIEAFAIVHAFAVVITERLFIEVAEQVVRLNAHVGSGNKTRLAPGMCFSDEPMIAIYGEFGIRLEDCFLHDSRRPAFFHKAEPRD
jgi:Xaa-Pro aminopeptidase